METQEKNLKLDHLMDIVLTTGLDALDSEELLTLLLYFDRMESGGSGYYSAFDEFLKKIRDTVLKRLK